MRIVRFHFEPWQKRGSGFTTTPCESPSLTILPPSVHRRQRSMDIDDISNIDKFNEHAKNLSKRLQEKLKWRYPQVVKKLSILCSDAIAKNVTKYILIKVKCLGLQIY